MPLPLVWIPEVLRAAGLVVVEYDGWETRETRPGITPRCVVAHHTATSPNTSNLAVARLLAVGRPDLSGPLSQLGLDRDGHYWMIAAGRCNHNGYGTYGNDSIGIEAYNTGVGEPWPAVQLDAYARGCAALLTHLHLPVTACMGHKETDPARKIDPAGINMPAFRVTIQQFMEDDDMPSIEDIAKVVDAAVAAQLDARGLTRTTPTKAGGAIGELRRNLRKTASASGVPATDIEA